MNFQTACEILGIEIQASLQETLRAATEAFRRSAIQNHPDRILALSQKEQEVCNERFGFSLEALNVIKKTLSTFESPKREERHETRDVESKRPLCVVNLRLTPEEMEPCGGERSFEVAYEDACFVCNRTGFRLETAPRFHCDPNPSSEIGSADNGLMCERERWNPLNFLCSTCKGEKKIRKTVFVRVPRWLKLTDGQYIMKFQMEEPTIYSGGTVRVRLKPQGPIQVSTPTQ